MPYRRGLNNVLFFTEKSVVWSVVPGFPKKGIFPASLLLQDLCLRDPSAPFPSDPQGDRFCSTPWAIWSNPRWYFSMGCTLPLCCLLDWASFLFVLLSAYLAEDLVLHTYLRLDLIMRPACFLDKVPTVTLCLWKYLMYGMWHWPFLQQFYTAHQSACCLILCHSTLCPRIYCPWYKMRLFYFLIGALWQDKTFGAMSPLGHCSFHWRHALPALDNLHGCLARQRGEECPYLSFVYPHPPISPHCSVLLVLSAVPTVYKCYLHDWVECLYHLLCIYVILWTP